MHFDVISERLAELGNLEPRDRRPNRVAMGATYEAGQKGLLGHDDDDFWFVVGAEVEARSRRDVRGLASQPRYISILEIREGYRRARMFSPHRSVGELLEITWRSFGFDTPHARFANVVAAEPMEEFRARTG